MSPRQNAEIEKQKRQETQQFLEELGSVSEVAKRLGCSRQAVWLRIKRYGLEEIQRQAHKKLSENKTDSQATVMLRMAYRENKTYAEIATILGTNEKHVFEVIGSVLSISAKTILDGFIRDTYATNIRTIRMLRGMTQKELADQAGIHQSGLAAIENKGGGLTNKMLKRLADALHTEIEVLLQPLSYETIRGPG